MTTNVNVIINLMKVLKNNVDVDITIITYNHVYNFINIDDYDTKGVYFDGDKYLDYDKIKSIEIK